MNGEALFNTIWVVESLKEGDLKAGYNLVHDQLVHIPFKNPAINIIYSSANNKEEFIEILNNIHDDVSQNDNYPMIHIDCHGNQEGLEVSSREIITWEELRPIFIKINIACKLNLIILLASCNGAHLIKVVTKLDRAPFWAVIGSENEVTAGSVERNYGEFYRVFAENLDGDAAMKALNQGKKGNEREYHFFSALGLFIKAYSHYHHKYCVGKAKKKRLENLLTKALRDPKVRGKGRVIKWVRRTLKDGLGSEEKNFRNYYKNFFMIDLYEENTKRFQLTFKDLLARAEFRIS